MSVRADLFFSQVALVEGRLGLSVAVLSAHVTYRTRWEVGRAAVLANAAYQFVSLGVQPPILWYLHYNNLLQLMVYRGRLCRIWTVRNYQICEISLNHVKNVRDSRRAEATEVLRQANSRALDLIFASLTA